MVWRFVIRHFRKTPLSEVMHGKSSLFYATVWRVMNAYSSHFILLKCDECQIVTICFAEILRLLIHCRCQAKGKGARRRSQRLLDAWSSRGKVVFDGQFHDHSDDFMNDIIKDVDDFEEECCCENKGEGIHLTGTKSIYKSRTSASEQAKLLLLSSRDNPLAADIQDHLETKYNSHIVQVQTFGKGWQFSIRHFRNMYLKWWMLNHHYLFVCAI